MGEEVGSGSFGTVYSAIDLADGTPVAVKVWAQDRVKGVG